MGLNTLPIYAVYSVQSLDVLSIVGKGGERIIYSYPDIGEQEALDYFPKLAAKLLVESISKCGDDVDCSRNHLLSKGIFDSNGIITASFTLKTIRDGKYVKLQN